MGPPLQRPRPRRRGPRAVQRDPRHQGVTRQASASGRRSGGKDRGQGASPGGWFLQSKVRPSRPANTSCGRRELALLPENPPCGRTPTRGAARVLGRDTGFARECLSHLPKPKPNDRVFLTTQLPPRQRIQDPGSRDHTNHEKHTMSAPPRRHNVSPKAQDHAASRQCGARCKWGKQTPASAVVTGSASPERTESRRVVSAWRQGAGVSLSATNTQQSRTGEHGYCMVKDGRPRCAVYVNRFQMRPTRLMQSPAQMLTSVVRRASCQRCPGRPAASIASGRSSNVDVGP